MFCFTQLRESSLENLIRKYYGKISVFNGKLHPKDSKKKDNIITFRSYYLFCNIIMLVQLIIHFERVKHWFWHLSSDFQQLILKHNDANEYRLWHLFLFILWKTLSLFKAIKILEHCYIVECIAFYIIL